MEISGGEESLVQVTTGLATQLLGRAVGVQGSVSNAALGAFIDGVASARLYRRNADSLFLVATRLDSTFTSASYRLVLYRALSGPQQGVRDFQPAFNHLWKSRTTLRTDQRVLLEALADSAGLVFRAQSLPRMERVSATLRGSAEAHALLGVMYYHVGELVGRDDWIARVRLNCREAIRLDQSSYFEACRRVLGELAWITRDANLLKRYAPDTPWFRYLGALLSGNQRQIVEARAEYVRDVAPNMAIPGAAPAWLNGLALPSREVDSLLAMLEPLGNSSDSSKFGFGLWTARAARDAGRPERVRQSGKNITGRDSVAFQRQIDGFLPETRQALSVAELADAKRRMPWALGVPCGVSLERMRVGDTTGAAAGLQTTAVLVSRRRQWGRRLLAGRLAPGARFGGTRDRDADPQRKHRRCHRYIAARLGWDRRDLRPRSAWRAGGLRT